MEGMPDPARKNPLSLGPGQFAVVDHCQGSKDLLRLFEGVVLESELLLRNIIEITIF